MGLYCREVGDSLLNWTLILQYTSFSCDEKHKTLDLLGNAASCTGAFYTSIFSGWAHATVGIRFDCHMGFCIQLTTINAPCSLQICVKPYAHFRCEADGSNALKTNYTKAFAIIREKSNKCQRHNNSFSAILSICR